MLLTVINLKYMVYALCVNHNRIIESSMMKTAYEKSLIPEIENIKSGSKNLNKKYKTGGSLHIRTVPRFLYI